MSDAPIPAPPVSVSERSAQRAAALGVAAAAAWAGWRAAVDLDPAGLWLDDAWVASLSRAPGFGLDLVQPASAPTLFMTLVGLGVRLAPDLELGAQLWPFVAGLLAIGCVGALTYRLTHSPVCATVAAALLGWDTGFGIYLARVKPFTGDALAVAALGLAFHSLVQRYCRRHLWTYVATAVVGFSISSFVLIVAAASSAVAGAALWARGVRDRHLGFAAGVLLGTALLLLAHITGRARAEMLTEFWQPFAISTRDAASFFGDLADFQRYTFARLLHGGGLHVGPLPGAAWASAGLAALGVLELWRSHQRTELVAGAAVLVTAIAASAAGHIPLGALRTDLFLLPFFAVLLACGVLAIARSAAAESFARREGVALALSAVIGAQIFEAPTARYPLEQAVAPAAKLARRFKPGDGLATNLHGSFALGTYWPGPLDFRDDARFAIPHPEPRVQSFTILDDASYRRVGTLPQPEGPQRLWVFLCHFQPDLLADLLARMEAETPYERAGTWRSKGCGLWLFEQPVVEPAATQPPALTLRRPPP